MIHDDALLAFERHATSKLRSADDLLSISTLGFRGEALPSIASVSRLLLETRAAEEQQGTSIEFAGGKLVGVKPAGVPTGTAVSVADLFYCVPARRKFLKSETTELGHIASLVTHYALAHPGKHFTLKTPTQEIVNVPPVETMAERVYQLFGRQMLDEMVEIPATSAPIRAAITEPELDEAGRAAELSVGGFVSRPEVQRSNRNGIYVFVNRRLVRDRVLLHAIHEAYRNILPAGIYPVALLFVTLSCEEVDVNVHPAKIEVRFRHSQFVHDFTRDVLRQALGRARPVPSFSAPAGSAAQEPAPAAAMKWRRRSRRFRGCGRPHGRAARRDSAYVRRRCAWRRGVRLDADACWRPRRSAFSSMAVASPCPLGAEAWRNRGAIPPGCHPSSRAAVRRPAKCRLAPPASPS